MDNSIQERRSSKRNDTDLSVRFSCDQLMYSSLHYGVVGNISDNGMLVKTGSCFPHNTSVALFIYRGKILRIHAKVKRVVKKKGFYHAMGLEVIEPSREYVEFVDRLE